MAKQYLVIPASRFCSDEVANNMRPADAQECADVGQTPLQALELGRTSGPAWAVCEDNGPGCLVKPLGMFGVQPTSGIVWSLYTSLPISASAYVVKHTPWWVEHQLSLLTCAPARLWNHVSENNKGAISWLRGSGCWRFDPNYDQLRNGTRYLYFTSPVLSVFRRHFTPMKDPSFNV